MGWFGCYLALWCWFWLFKVSNGIGQRRVIRQWTIETVTITICRPLLPVIALVQYLTYPTDIPRYFHWIGVALYCLGSWLSISALAVNPYAIPEIVKPPRMVKDGVYKYLRHPHYDGQLAVAFGASLILGQSWTCVPLAIYVLVVSHRIHRENRLLYK